MLIECILLSASLCHAMKDTPVLALTAAHAASVVADIRTTQAFERRGYHEGQSAWILGREPSVGRMALTLVPEIVVETFIAERMHRSHTWIRHIWWVPQIISIGVHTQASIYNSRLH